MGVLSILYFLIVTLCLGYTLLKFAPQPGNFLERNLMRIGFGMAFFIVLGFLFNLMRVPLDWKIFLFISLILPVIDILRKFKGSSKIISSIRLTKYDLSIIIMLLLFAATFYMYSKGAFSYPYLEDDDPWSHAITAKFVSANRQLLRPSGVSLPYIDPYPPAYSLFMGVLHQTNDSISWTLKFFNALIVSLSIVFFYFFANKLTESHKKALFSVFAIASVPAFMSHFIWSISLVIPLYFVSLYALEKIMEDKKWIYAASVSIGATLMITPSHSTYFGFIFLIYYAAKAITEKKLLLNTAIAGFFGLLISFLLWWLPSVIRHGVKGTLDGIGLGPTKSIFHVLGTGDKMYTWKDFFIAQKINMINNPTGIGITASLLLIISLTAIAYKHRNAIRESMLSVILLFAIIFSATLLFLSRTYMKYVQRSGIMPLEKGSVPFFEFLHDQVFLAAILGLFILLFASMVVVNYKHKLEEKHIIITLALTIFSFYAVNSAPFFYKISPFRTWMILAIPVAILASEGAMFLAGIFRKSGIARIATMIIIVTGVLLTSSYQKYAVNTAQWPPGGFWTSYEEINGYVWLKGNIPPNAKVFTFINSGAVIGMDKYICRWCPDEMKFQENGFKSSASEIRNWLKGKDYEYFIIDGGTVKKFGINETKLKLQDIASSGGFRLAHQNPAFFLFKI